MIHRNDAHHWQVLLSGLRPGQHTVQVQVPSGAFAAITLVDHPIGGPIFSGGQLQPWVCTTTAHGLAPASDAQCDAPTQISYVYKNAATGTFETYEPTNPPPDATVARTTTQSGATVRYVVRFETGVQDRGIYQLAVLDEPGQQPRPSAPPPAWNHKLVWAFAGGCNPDHQQAGPDDANTNTVLNDQALGLGFAVEGSGMTTLGSDCNPVVSAEAVSMGKEHLIDEFGPVKWTIGQGCSGGSIQQQVLTAAYPGLVDGVTVNCSFPDVLEVYDEAVCASLDSTDLTDPPATLRRDAAVSNAGGWTLAMRRPALRHRRVPLAPLGFTTRKAIRAACDAIWRTTSSTSWAADRTRSRTNPTTTVASRTAGSRSPAA